MTSTQPTVSVIIPARDAAAALPATLAAIRAQTYPRVIDVVVAAADDATAAAAEHMGARVIANPRGITPRSLNLAIAATKGDVVVRCDANAHLLPDYIQRAIDTLERTGAACVGGMQVAVGTTPWEKAIAAAMSSRMGAGGARYRIGGGAGPAETVYLGVFRREVLKELGGFDEEFVRTQDYELNHRITAAGGLVWFDPALKVTYRPRGSLQALARQYFDYGRAKRMFNRKHPGSLRLRQVVPPVLVVCLFGSLIVAVRWPAAIVVPALYGLSLMAASLRPSASPFRMAAALGVMQLSWGCGFLLGGHPRP